MITLPQASVKSSRLTLVMTAQAIAKSFLIIFGKSSRSYSMFIVLVVECKLRGNGSHVTEFALVLKSFFFLAKGTLRKIVNVVFQGWVRVGSKLFQSAKEHRCEGWDGVTSPCSRRCNCAA